MTARRHTRQRQKQDRRLRDRYLYRKQKEEREALTARGGDTSKKHRPTYEVELEEDKPRRRGRKK